MRRGLVLFAIFALTSAAEAHHSIAAVYDSSKRLTLDGVVAEFHFVNPHPFLLIDVRDATGRTQQWRGEMDNRYELADIGIAGETFKPGDRIVVTGSLGKVQPQSLYIMKLERPADGLSYEQVGQSPRLRK